MKRQDKLIKKLEKYQEQYQTLLKTDKAASARYGNEDRDMTLRVLESAVFEIKKELEGLKPEKQES